MNTKYELMVILKPMLPEDIRAGIEKRMEGLLSKMGGKITHTDVWGKKHLAYDIKGHEEGYYIVYDFELEGKKLKEFEAEMKLVNDALRFLVTRKDNQ